MTEEPKNLGPHPRPGWVYGNGPEAEAYMRKWMADHPGPWHRCPKCKEWRLTTKPDGHCPVCPSKAK